MKKSTAFVILSYAVAVAACCLVPDIAEASTMGASKLKEVSDNTATFISELGLMICGIAFMAVGAQAWFSKDDGVLFQGSTRVMIATGVVAGGVTIATQIFGASAATVGL